MPKVSKKNPSPELQRIDAAFDSIFNKPSFLSGLRKHHSNKPRGLWDRQDAIYDHAKADYRLMTGREELLSFCRRCFGVTANGSLFHAIDCKS